MAGTAGPATAYRGQAPEGPPGWHPLPGLRYLDPVLAAYVGDSVIIRYDPRDVAEVRVFTAAGFLSRPICPELAGTTVILKEISSARMARQRELLGGLHDRATVVDRLIAVHQEPQVQAQPRDANCLLISY